MAKVKTTKKKNLKMRRQIRKTFGGLFMASAIAIAAIPVQNLSAETLKVEEPGFVDGRGNPAYSVGADLELDPNNILTKPTNPDQIFTSYSVRELSDKSFSLNWQFKYYVTTVDGNTRAIICEYNDLYPENEVVLGNSAHAGYYTVTEDEFNAFYSSGGLGYQEYTLTYDNIKMVESGGADPDIDWFIKHAKENYDKFVAKCDEYDEYLKEKALYDKALADYESDPENYPNPGAAPVVVEKPADVTFNPAIHFDNTQKSKYYCDLASELSPGTEGYLPGTGYTLVPVTDNVSPGMSADGTAKKVYLAKGGTPNIGANNDGNGFLATSASTEIIGISNNAFENIENVDTLSLPKEIKYVGDEAFKNSFIKSITFTNVADIGNRAFQDCSQLSSVSLSGTVKIGVEAFKNSGVVALTLPYSVDQIGDGAFAECHKLQTVDMSAITATCKVEDYAFYNCYALNDVQMEKTGIVSLGEGVFAISNVQTGSWNHATLPEQITGASGSEIGDYLFAGRDKLSSVKFPVNYGLNGVVNVPAGTFKNCSGLSYVDFTTGAGSTVCGNAGFDISADGSNVTYNNLFVDVLNPDFYVMGPEKNINGKEAYPRQSTWQSFTRVSNFVPYVYVNSQGVKCYEVSDGEYLLQANENKELTSCRPIDKKSTEPIDLIIPARVGAYDIETIANGAMSDENLRQRIRTITIQDESLTTLGDSVFEGLKNLEKVEIGNSVNSIGTRTFANCPKLIDVTFQPPLIGYDNFTIGTDAFKTGSNELTMHGDIVKGYEPFEFAMGKDTGKIDDAGKRICYKSLEPDFLTVMYDNKAGDVTLLDYPKYSELDERNLDHLEEMEEFYYAKYGGVTGTYSTVVNELTGVEEVVYDENGLYDTDRIRFTEVWIASGGDASAYEDPSYGPWIDESYLELLNQGYFTDGAVPSMPKKYFTQKPYSIIENFERGSNATMEYQTVTDKELQWINTCLNIVIPEGVTSIDAASFFTATENNRNVSTYFGSGDEGYKSYQMCTKSQGDGAIPGLFSGYYKDYEDGSEEGDTYETELRGNDRILSITMYDVKSLPDYAFDSCERLQRVVLGDDLSEMGKAPFRGCDAMTDIAGNDYFEAENRIIYFVNQDGTYTIKECLPSRGGAGNSGIVITSSDPKIANVSAIEEGAFEDCDNVVKVLLEDASKLEVVPKYCFNDCDKLNEVTLPSTVNRIEEKAFGGNVGIEVTIPGKEVHIVKDAFEHVPTNTIRTYRDTSADDYGHYYDITVEYLSDLYTVRFLDYDGKLLKEETDIVAGQSATPPDVPERVGYTFTGWSGDYNNVTENRTLIAQYSNNAVNKHKVIFYNYNGKVIVSEQMVDHDAAAIAPVPPSRKGYKFLRWVPGNFDKVTQDMEIYATYEKKVTSPNATPDPGTEDDDDDDKKTTQTTTPETRKYTVSVSGGSGSGSYPAGAIVAINAYAKSSGQTFDKWTTSTAGVGFADPNAISTTFTMPAANVAITATYKTGGSTGAVTNPGGYGGTTGGGGGTTTNTGSGGTTIEVTKPGISNTGLAGVTVNGATDNFIVKVTEDSQATAAVTAALQAKYGDISRIKYLAMDVSLYDATGRTKITDTTGISVNITLPIPDELIQYAGNNKVGVVVNGMLEDVNARFTTVDGVPCLNFTASHFTPYAIYVDTANLSAGAIDATPKTGDPIHPKWFLAIGMACISLILFFKKDKTVIPVKTA